MDFKGEQKGSRKSWQAKKENMVPLPGAGVALSTASLKNDCLQRSWHIEQPRSVQVTLKKSGSRPHSNRYSNSQFASPNNSDNDIVLQSRTSAHPTPVQDDDDPRFNELLASNDL